MMVSKRSRQAAMGTAPLLLALATAAMVVCSQKALAFSTSATSRTLPLSSLVSPLQAATTQNVVFDGPEWASIQDVLKVGGSPQQPFQQSTPFGLMTVVVGTRDDTGDRIVGVVAEDNSNDLPTIALKETSHKVYQHSAASLANSKKLSDQDAIHTMVAALTGVYCTAPRVEGVGGASDNDMVLSGKVVILGGSDYACFAAKGLAALGSQVSLVSTNHQKVPVRNNPNVEVLPPAVGDEEIGFASFIGDFDAVLDTAADERPSRRPLAISDNDNDDEDEDDDENDMMGMGTTLRLLKQRHKCERYVSSMTQSQNIINKEGVFFGPGKVKDHFKDVESQLENKHNFQPIVPPSSFGQTVETLLEKGIVYKNNKDFLLSSSKGNSNLLLRGWSLKDFMETSMWPTDSSGGGTRVVRFGLPVVEEDEKEMEFTMISAPPLIGDRVEEEDQQKIASRDAKNPFVRQIVGEPDLYQVIIKEKRDSVLFLSATFCKTCKTLNPRYTRLARTHLTEQNQNNPRVESVYDDSYDGLLFAKADVGGKVGKELSRVLNVDAVPAFILFRNGRRFGPALSVSRIPSKKLTAAIELLESGEGWDSSVIKEAEAEEKNR